MFFFYSDLRLTQSHLGLILAHAALGTPFVVITVTATLSGFDRNLVRASQSLGAGPLTTFRRVQLPLIAPGVLSGALFAFAASFDEVVVVLFMGGLNQRTIPRQMWSGIREEISPTILAAATFLIAFALRLPVRGGAPPQPHPARLARDRQSRQATPPARERRPLVGTARRRRAAGKNLDSGGGHLSAGTPAFGVIRTATWYTPFAALRAAVPAGPHRENWPEVGVPWPARRSSWRPRRRHTFHPGRLPTGSAPVLRVGVLRAPASETLQAASVQSPARARTPEAPPRRPRAASRRSPGASR